MEPLSTRDDHRIRSALERAIEIGEIGISVAVYHRGELIVDAVAGLANEESQRPADAQTLWPVFSVTKGITALAVHIQADRGLLKVDAPISQYWPEFSTNGKENITIEEALSHRAGIPQMPEGVTPELMRDWKWMTDKIAQFTPVFRPGSENAYHPLVWGWIVGEVVRRTDPEKRPFDVFVYDEICKPLGIKDFYLGVPDAALPRVAKLYGGNVSQMESSHNIRPNAVYPGSNVHNLPVVQQTVDPGAGAIATAGAVARIFAAIANGGELDRVRLLSHERVASFTKPRPAGLDKVMQVPIQVGLAGYFLGGEPGASDPLVADHRDIIYSPGAGGSFAWADLRDGISVAICHNNMDSPTILQPERTIAPIVRAIREVISERDRQ